MNERPQESESFSPDLSEPRLMLSSLTRIDRCRLLAGMRATADAEATRASYEYQRSTVPNSVVDPTVALSSDRPEKGGKE